MSAEPYPITVLFSILKSCGISNRDAAVELLDVRAALANRSIEELVESKSQLSRRIVHAAPENLPPECFIRFTSTAPTLASRIIDRRSVERHKGDLQAAAKTLVAEELGEGHQTMERALLVHGSDAPSYREALTCINELTLATPNQLVTLHLLALIVAGCTANGQLALANVMTYALDELDEETHTAKTGLFVSGFQEDSAGPSSTATFGIARVRDGVITSGTKFHPIGEDGLTIGMLPRVTPAATDVDHDVSLCHARLWLEDGKLFLEDLGSTNGTSVISPGTERLAVAAFPEDLRDKVPPRIVELHYGDFICLGATTRYIVLPGILPDGIKGTRL